MDNATPTMHERLQQLKARAAGTMQQRRGQARRSKGVRPTRAHDIDGPGACLKERLREWNVPGCKGCMATAKKMNRLGPEGCAARRAELIEEILLRARKWVSAEGTFRTSVLAWASTIPFVGKMVDRLEDATLRMAIGRLLIDWAIAESRERQKKRAVDVLMVIAHGVVHWHEKQTGFGALCAAGGISSQTAYLDPDPRHLETAIEEWKPRVCVVRAIPYHGDDIHRIVEQYLGIKFVLVSQSLPSHLVTWEGTVDRFTSSLGLSQELPNVWLATPDDREPWRDLTPRSLWWPNCTAEVPHGEDGPIVGPLDLSLIGRRDTVKSFPNQIMAAAIANQTRRCRLHLMTSGESKDLRDLAEACDLEVFEHGWRPHDEHRVRMSALIDIGLQAGFCESWNYVALEHLLAGKPVVGSPTIRFLPPEMQADPNDIGGMAAMILRLADQIDADPAGARAHCRAIGQRTADRVNTAVVATLRRLLES